MNQQDTKQRTRASGQSYALFSSAFSFLALIGLILGTFLPTAIDRAITARPVMAGGSLLGLLLELFRSNLPAINPSLSGILWTKPLLSLFLYALPLIVVSSVLLAILSLLRPSRAKTLCFCNGYLVFFSYSFLLWSAMTYLGFQGSQFFLSHVDLPALLITLACLGLFIWLGVLQGGKGAIFDGILFISLSLSVFALLFPTKFSLTMQSMFVKFRQKYLFELIISCILLLICTFNAVYTLLFLGKENKLPFDLLRYGIQGSAILVLWVASAASRGDFSIFTDQILTMLLLLCSTLAPLAFTALRRVNKK